MCGLRCEGLGPQVQGPRGWCQAQCKYNSIGGRGPFLIALTSMHRSPNLRPGCHALCRATWKKTASATTLQLGSCKAFAGFSADLQPLFKLGVLCWKALIQALHLWARILLLLFTRGCISSELSYIAIGVAIMLTIHPVSPLQAIIA